MAVKYYDTYSGWLIRGYKVVENNTPIGIDREGREIYSWGQVDKLKEGERPNEDKADDDTAPTSGVIKPVRKGASTPSLAY